MFSHMFQKNYLLNTNKDDGYFLEKFNDTYYYKIKRDVTILNADHNLVAEINAEGAELIAQFYKKKYHANITLYEKFTFWNMASKDTYHNEIKKKGEKNQEYREGFLLRDEYETHTSPLIYIRNQDQKEALFYADSIESMIGYDVPLLERVKNKIHAYAFIINQSRQADGYTCTTDALCFIRDAVSYTNTGTYRIPNLFDFLLTHSTLSIEDNFYIVKKLPDELLKTSQISKFTYDFRIDSTDGNSNKIHKNETLDEFRQRHTKSANFRTSKKNTMPRDISTYTKVKSLKYIDIIEIQFYLNQLNSLFNGLNEKNEKQFITESKIELKKQFALYQDKKRPGLYSLVIDFIKKLTLDPSYSTFIKNKI